MQDGVWDRWGQLVATAPTDGDLSAVLRLIAAEVRGAKGLQELGVEVQRHPMVGRLGGIVHRSGRRIVLVDETLDGPAELFVTAHELAHLVLSYVRRTIQDEEELCDQFAELVIGSPRPAAIAPQTPRSARRTRGEGRRAG